MRDEVDGVPPLPRREPRYEEEPPLRGAGGGGGDVC